MFVSLLLKNSLLGKINKSGEYGGMDMILGLEITVLIIMVLRWALKIALSVAVIFSLVGLVMLIISHFLSMRGRRSTIR
jgi:hypothetical protein